MQNTGSTKEISSNSRLSPSRQAHFLFLLSLLATLELSVAGLVTLLISPDPKNAAVFGFSIQRLLLVAGIWLLALFVLLTGFKVREQKISLDSFRLLNRKGLLRSIVYGISFALIAWGWLSVVCPPYLFHRFVYFYERLRPFSVALGAALAQGWLFSLFVRGRLDFFTPARPVIKRYRRPLIFFSIVMIGLGIFIAITKFGLLADLIYSNVPGVPLSGLQFFLIILVIGLWIVLLPGPDHSMMRIAQKYQLIPILIFLATVLVWGLTPMLRHVFSLEPAAPGYQPFPNSDARLHDLGGISILRGYGIFFYRNYDKPLYMIFLALLHLFAGNDYGLMTWLQILVLAALPVVLYFLGTKFHSPAFGIFLSLVMILRQRNAIVLSYRISSTNPKLFMAEELTLLGIILIACLVFQWMRDQKIWLALLCGGCIGAATLIRSNSFLLFPAIACLVMPAFWVMGKKFILKHLSAFSAAFLLLLIPWALGSITPEGKPWLLLKLRDIYDLRYGAPAQSSLPSSLGGLGMVALAVDEDPLPFFGSESRQEQAFLAHMYDHPFRNIHGRSMDVDDTPDDIARRILYHFFHNFSSSVMSLPDSVIYDDLNHLSQRIYWIDGGNWQGQLPFAQAGLVFLNLALLAIGLGYSWAHHRWSGMIPLVIFIAYSISLSVVMNSGGRYIVPIDWAIYYYYGVAVVAILRFVLKVLSGWEQNWPLTSVSAGSGRPSGKSQLGSALAVVIILASLVPVANFLIPAVTAPSRDQAQVDAVRERLPGYGSPGLDIVYGEILYPYYVDDRLTFNFLTPTGAEYYMISRTPGLEGYLKDGDAAFLALHSDGQGNAAVTAIYTWQGSGVKLIWEPQP